MAFPHFLARRVKQRIRRGSSSPIVVETDAGVFVAKLSGAGQGTPALVAEVVVAELAERLGLPVPERVLIELPPDVPSDDRNDELRDLIERSAGLNLGFRWLEGAVDANLEKLSRIDAEFQVSTLWLDGLVMNPDRTDKNPNVLLWRNQPWLIDHGVALTFQHDWANLTELSPREPSDSSHHVFRERRPLLADHDVRLAARLTRKSIADALTAVPDAWLLGAARERDVTRARGLYETFLWKRLQTPRPFVEGGRHVAPLE